MFQGFRFCYPYSPCKDKAFNWLRGFFNLSCVAVKIMVNKPNLVLNRNVSCFNVVFRNRRILNAS